MAPEVFLHEPYNAKVDVYSFAMICYELFEGRMPFDGTDAVQAAKDAAMHRQRPSMSPLVPSASNKEIREVWSIYLSWLYLASQF
jgi:serine/threonine protein kinase